MTAGQRLRPWVWFAVLYATGVATVGLVAYALRALLMLLL
jgi:hypothetical protein